eukprot:jgi/Tetstr1/447363/TSEL_034800.t1
MSRPVSVLVGGPEVLSPDMWTEVFGFVPDTLDRAAAAAACRAFRAAVADSPPPQEDRPPDDDPLQDRPRHLLQDPDQDPPQEDPDQDPEQEDEDGADEDLPGDATVCDLGALTPAASSRARTLAVAAAVSGSRARLRWCVEETGLVRQALRVNGGLRAMFRALGARGDPEFLGFAVDSVLVGEACVPVDMHAVCDGAARAGHTAVLRWVALREFGGTAAYSETETETEAEAEAETGTQNQRLNPSSPRGFTAAKSAASSGNLAVLRWLRDPPAPAPEGVSARERAVMHWSWCSIEEEVFQAAAAEGHVHVLEWLHSRRPNFGPAAVRKNSRHTELRHWLENSACPYRTHSAFLKAVSGGHLQAAAWIAEHSGEVDLPGAYESAVSNGRLEVLDWLGTLSPPARYLKQSFYVQAAWRGNFASLKWLERQNVPWSADHFMRLAREVMFTRHRDSPETMKWLGERGVKWDLEAALTWDMSAELTAGHLVNARWILDLLTSPEVQSNLAHVVLPGQVAEVARKIRRREISFPEHVTLATTQVPGALAALKQLHFLIPNLLPPFVLDPRSVRRICAMTPVCLELLDIIAAGPQDPMDPKDPKDPDDRDWNLKISNCIFFRETEAVLCILRHKGDGLIRPSTVMAAAASGNFELVRWLFARANEAWSDDIRRYISRLCPRIAAELGDLPMVRWWMRREFRTSARDGDGFGPLCCAAYRKGFSRKERVHIPQSLLESGGEGDVCEKCKRWCQDVEDAFAGV